MNEILAITYIITLIIYLSSFMIEKKNTLTSNIIQDIVELIMSGQLKPNDRLPTERDLSQKYNVSRGRIREALRGLSTVGLIDIKVGSGSFVRDNSHWVNSNAISWLFRASDISFDDLFEVRDILEKAVLKKAFNLCNNIDLQDLGKLVDKLNIMRQESIEDYADALDEFDLRMVEITRNDLLIRMIQILVFLRRPTVEDFLKAEGAVENSFKLRNNVYQAFYKKEKETAIEAIEQFFRDYYEKNR